MFTDLWQFTMVVSPSSIVYIQINSNSFSDLAAFFSGASFKFSCEGEGKLDLCQLVPAQTCLYGIKKTRTHRAHNRGVSLLKKILVSRNELREIENIGACQRVNRQFSAPSA